MDEYISREAAIDKMRSLKSSFRAKNDWDSGYDTAIAEAFEHIKRVPAADVQPVKHGQWKTPVSVGNGIKFCSVCRNEAYWDTDYGQQLFDYCPYCGARMDLKDSDDETL